MYEYTKSLCMCKCAKLPRLDSPGVICFANTPVSSALPAAFGLIALTSLCAQNQNTLAERLHLTQNKVTSSTYRKQHK